MPSSRLAHPSPRWPGQTTSVPETTLGSHWTDVSGVRIHARAGGNSASAYPAVVLLHGLSISSRYMARLGAELAGWTRVYALDLPGFGLSDKPGAVLDIPAMADATAAWMTANHIPRAIVLGNSVGAQVAVNLAARYPSRTSGIVLTGLALGGQRRNTLSQLARALVDIPREPLALWPMQARDFVAAGPRRVIRTLRLAMEDRIAALIPAVLAPALLLEGTADPLDDPAWNRQLVAALPYGRLVRVPGGTHALPMSKPSELATIVRTFADDLI